MLSMKDMKISFISQCRADQKITHIMHEGKQLPLALPSEAKEISCCRCKGTKGFYIPHLQTWSCLNPDCIVKNDNRKQLVETNAQEGALLATQSNKCMLDECRQSEEVLRYLKAYSDNPSGFIIFSGTPGSGKTYAAKAVMNDILGALNEKIFFKQTELCELWLDEFTKWKTTKHLVEKFSQCKIFILDDVGTRKPTEAFSDFLYSVIDKRYESQSATILTTNLNSKQMREQFGDAFVSRAASGKCFRLENPDRRIEEF